MTNPKTVEEDEHSAPRSGYRSSDPGCGGRAASNARRTTSAPPPSLVANSGTVEEDGGRRRCADDEHDWRMGGCWTCCAPLPFEVADRWLIDARACGCGNAVVDDRKRPVCDECLNEEAACEAAAWDDWTADR